MRRVLIALAIALVTGLASGAVPDCVQVRTSAPYRGLGYDHVVTIRNGCPAPVRCRIETNVNPDPIDVRVEANETKDVVTFRGSPARTFQARVQCDKG